jgi:hypothetical protein
MKPGQRKKKAFVSTADGMTADLTSQKVLSTAGKEATAVEQLSSDAKLTALGSLQDWSKWLVGIDAGVLGLLMFAAQKIDPKESKGITVLILAIISFSVSLIIATWLVGAMPAFIMRVKAGDTWNNKTWWIDCSAGNIYGFTYGFIPVQVYSALQHLFFIAGVVLLAISLSLSLGAYSDCPLV